MGKTTATNPPMTPQELEALFNRRFLAWFGFFLVAAGMAYVAAVTFGTVPKDNQQFANIVLGFILGTVIGTPIAFFYASSKSSQTKDATIKEVLESPPAAKIVEPPPKPLPAPPPEPPLPIP